MQLNFDSDDLQPIIAKCVEAVLERLEPLRVQFGNKLMFTEPEAASITGLKAAHLGELRRTGKVPHQQIGGRIFYNRSDILRIAGMTEAKGVVTQ